MMKLSIKKELQWTYNKWYVQNEVAKRTKS